MADAAKTVVIQAVRPSGEPPLLLFDLGDILVRISKADVLWPGLDLSTGGLPFEQRWVRSQVVRDYETGRLRGLQNFYRAARAEIDITVAEEEFPPLFYNIIGVLFDETIPILTALQDVYPLMLLSNIGEDHWIYCRDTLGLGRFFEKTWLSYEMGLMKPDSKIYSAILRDSKRDPETIFYFDDRIENCQAAREFGIRAIHTFGGSQMLTDLRQMNLIM